MLLEEKIPEYNLGFFCLQEELLKAAISDIYIISSFFRTPTQSPPFSLSRK